MAQSGFLELYHGEKNTPFLGEKQMTTVQDGLLECKCGEQGIYKR